jgi:SpoIID/LytB domain protein
VSSPEPIWAGPVTDGAQLEVVARRLRYRGELEIGGDPLRVVNELDVEQYLWGLGEVSSAWSPNALRAQIVAARTYALRAMAANGEICDTQRCQVYKGASGEFAAQVQAVNDTLGTVLTWNGGYASTVYSANAAGVTATPMEGFGNPDAAHPYLPSVPYTSRSDVRYEVPIALGDHARRLGYAGTATTARVATTGPSGRALTVEVDGSSGVLSVPAIQVQRAMGLRSTQWTLRLDSADVAPEAPEAADVVQAAPEDVAVAVASETERMRVRVQRADGRALDGGTSDDAELGEDDGGLDPLAWPLLVAVLAAGAVGTATLRRRD